MGKGKRALRATCLALALIAGAVSTAAAVDQGRVGDANAALVKAKALLQAAGVDRAGHVTRAIADINAALSELTSVS